MTDSVYSKLNKLNVNDKTEKKNGLTYLSWAWAWAKVKEMYPEASYEVVHYDGKPYLYDENLGYMVATTVTIEGQTLPMQLPVMDGANKAMKAQSYEYKTKYDTKTVQAATMFDINKAMMRCLVKNLAMFGLGLYIYAGEDMPEVPVEYMTDEHVAELEAHATSNGFTLSQIAQAYQIKDIKLLHDEQLQQAKDLVNGWVQANQAIDQKINDFQAGCITYDMAQLQKEFGILWKEFSNDKPRRDRLQHIYSERKAQLGG